MKQLPHRDETDRFNAPLRHYHRSSAQTNRTWDEWVEGGPTASRSAGKWLRIVVIVAALLALGGIAVGLFIELG